MSEPVKELYKICQEERTKLGALLAETALERNILKAENEALRADCAAMLDGLREILRRDQNGIAWHDLMGLLLTDPDNPGQALLDRLKVLERARDAAAIYLRNREIGVVNKAYKKLEEALAACKKETKK